MIARIRQRFYQNIQKNRFCQYKGVVLMVTILAVGMLNSCRQPTEPQKELEEVLPNVVTLTLTSTAPQETVTAVWRSSSDKPNANARITIDTLRLTAGRTYTGVITAVNDLRSPNVLLHEEYRRLANEHQFFYTVTGDAASRMSITITDRDGNNLPLGLQFTVVVSSGGSVRGLLNVVLSHYDDVRKDGRTRSPESDIDITFPVLIR